MMANILIVTPIVFLPIIQGFISSFTTFTVTFTALPIEKVNAFLKQLNCFHPKITVD